MTASVSCEWDWIQGLSASKARNTTTDALDFDRLMYDVMFSIPDNEFREVTGSNPTPTQTFTKMTI